MAVASLVLGIVSIVFGAFIPGLQWVGIACGVVGIVLSVMAKKKGENSAMATAGLVCSIIGTALSSIFFIACVACVSSVQTYGNALENLF